MNSEGQGDAQSALHDSRQHQGADSRIDYEQIPNLAVNEITAGVLLKVYKDIYLNTFHDYSLVVI